MMLYHPDRGPYHRKELDRLAAALNDHDAIAWATVIFCCSKGSRKSPGHYASAEDIDYSPVYEWDWDADGFHIVSDRTE